MRGIGRNSKGQRFDPKRPYRERRHLKGLSGKGDKDRTDNKSQYSKNYQNIDWGNDEAKTDKR